MKGLGSVSATIPSSSSPALAPEHVGTVKESEDNRVMELNIGLQKDTDRVDDIPSSVSKQENRVSNFPRMRQLHPQETTMMTPLNNS